MVAIVLALLLVWGGPVCTHIFIYLINTELTLGVKWKLLYGNRGEQRMVRKPATRKK